MPPALNKSTSDATANRSISLLIPAYNEELTLEATVNRCLDVLVDCDVVYEVIILDDCSTDGTAAIAHSLQAAIPMSFDSYRTRRIVELRPHSRNFTEQRVIIISS